MQALVIWVIIAVVFALYIISLILDFKISLKGIAQGVAVEGNTLLDKLAGTNKPSAKAFILYGIGEAIILGFPAWFGALTDNPYFAIISLGTLGVMVVKHYLGYRAWVKFGVKL
jgi:hypothetical protein